MKVNIRTVCCCGLARERLLYFRGIVANTLTATLRHWQRYFHLALRVRFPLFGVASGNPFCGEKPINIYGTKAL